MIENVLSLFSLGYLVVDYHNLNLTLKSYLLYVTVFSSDDIQVNTKVWVFNCL